MPDFLSIKDVQELPPDPPAPQHATSQTELTLPSNLLTCQDCGQSVSRHAETCPHCGRFFQRFTAHTLTIDRSGWSWTIAGGVLLAMIIPWVIAFALFAFIIISGGLLAAAGSAAGK